MYKFTKITLEEIQRLAPALGCKFAVYMLLRLFAGSNGVAYPSQSRLSDLSGYSDRQVRRALKNLQDEGHIEHIGYHQGVVSTAKYKLGHMCPTPQDRSVLPSRTNVSYPIGQMCPTINKKEKEKEEKEEKKPSDFSLSDSQSTQSTSTFSPKKSRINWDTIKRL